MEKKFRRDMSSLDNVFAFLNEFKKKSKLAHSVASNIDLIVEELFTNMIKYSSESPNDILIHIQRSDNKLILILNDFDVEPFDITKVDEVDTNQCIEERKVGGLGIHLVKCIADEIDYEYCDRTSKITIIKNLET
ncbi:MAG: ATP-binding protein [Gemmatimonadota bacterium]|nr:MAG: ATP-binding protein [Gemmatimonadota bacterium]